jgi:hypothetical protein
VIGRRYPMPHPTRLALERVFEAPVDGIIVIENSLYARAHLGMYATTRPNRILLASSGARVRRNLARAIRTIPKRYLKEFAQ